ncbi:MULTISPECIES: hypothetical protein [Actinomycetes]|uniref:hypothetical protein n=1 Tax=Actinomycetes TaxID=1760 RepID=UPI0031F7275F
MSTTSTAGRRARHHGGDPLDTVRAESADVLRGLRMDVGQAPHAVRPVLLEADTDTDAGTGARIARVLIGTVTEPTTCVKAPLFSEPLIVEGVRPRTQYS